MTIGILHGKTSMAGFLFPGLVAVMMGLAGCASPKGPGLDPKIKLLAGTAAKAYECGEIERAGTLYQKALQRARLIDDSDEVARNAYNLALCQIALNHLSEARSLLSQAGALSANRGCEVARILVAEAEVAALSGSRDESDNLARKALEAGPDADTRVQALLIQGEVALERERLPVALDRFKSAQSGLTENTPALIRARLELVAVRMIQLKLIEGDEAERHLDRAQWLKKAGQYRMMVQALDEAAQGYERGGQWDKAFKCRIRATQSLLAAGDKVSALAMLRKAAELAERSDEPGNQALVLGLAENLK